MKKTLYLITLVVAIVSFVLLTKEQSKPLENPSAKGQVIQKSFFDKEKQCLVNTLWHESRGEGKEGIKAVLSVIKNRKEAEGFPGTYCGVIQQPRQFSYVHERQAKNLTLKPVVKTQQDKKILEFIEEISDKALKNSFQSTLPASVLWYTKVNVKRSWMKVKQIHAVIGQHKFLKRKDV
jgi:spore germination cell wall hydrolase CwlJ-like protein